MANDNELVDFSTDERFGGYINNLSGTASTVMRDSDGDINPQQHRSMEFIQRRLDQRLSRRDRAMTAAIQQLEQNVNTKFNQLTTCVQRIATAMDLNIDVQNNENQLEPRHDHPRGADIRNNARQQQMARPQSRREDSLPRQEAANRSENQSNMSRQNPQRIALRHDAVCTDDEISPDLTIDQYKMVIKHLKLPVLHSVENYKNFKAEFDRYLIDTNYPAPYMRMRYLQAMAEGCQEAQAFAKEMKRVGIDFSYRRLVQEADKYFGLHHKNTGVLMRRLSQAYQKADESLNDWYSRMFGILQDILDK